MAGQTGHCAGAALKLLALLIISNCVKVVAWTDKRAAEGETVKIRAVLEVRGPVVGVVAIFGIQRLSLRVLLFPATALALPLGSGLREKWYRL